MGTQLSSEVPDIAPEANGIREASPEIWYEGFLQTSTTVSSSILHGSGPYYGYEFNAHAGKHDLPGNSAAIRSRYVKRTSTTQRVPEPQALRD